MLDHGFFWRKTKIFWKSSKIFEFLMLSVVTFLYEKFHKIRIKKLIIFILESDSWIIDFQNDNGFLLRFK